ncbi:MAG: hypothetical protein ACTTI3_09030, partial [Treponema sp.]
VVAHECIRITLFNSHILPSVTIMTASFMLQKYPSYSIFVSNSSSDSISSFQPMLLLLLIFYFGGSLFQN